MSGIYTDLLEVAEDALHSATGYVSEDFVNFPQWFEDHYHYPAEESKKNMGDALLGVNMDYLLLHNDLSDEEITSFNRGDMVFINDTYVDAFTLPDTFTVRNYDTGAEATIKNGGGITQGAFPISGIGQGDAPHRLQGLRPHLRHHGTLQYYQC